MDYRDFQCAFQRVWLAVLGLALNLSALAVFIAIEPRFIPAPLVAIAAAYLADNAWPKGQFHRWLCVGASAASVVGACAAPYLG
jgi:hypothetical protein